MCKSFVYASQNSSVTATNRPPDGLLNAAFESLHVTKRSKNGTPFGMPFSLGGKGGIRSRLRRSVRDCMAISSRHLTATGSHSLPARSNPFQSNRKQKTPSCGWRFLFWLPNRDSVSRDLRARSGCGKTVHRTLFLHAPVRIPYDPNETKTDTGWCLFLFWLPNRDSNPNKQSQSLSCYRYTIRQCPSNG